MKTAILLYLLNMALAAMKANLLTELPRDFTKDEYNTPRSSGSHDYVNPGTARYGSSRNSRNSISGSGYSSEGFKYGSRSSSFDNETPAPYDLPRAPLHDLSLTTLLLTLPSFLSHFTTLPAPLQSHFLLTLLRHSPESPLPVIRTLHSRSLFKLRVMRL
jgi:hypothetical protein